MNANSERRLLRGHFWASCAIMFGVGYLVLSQIKYGILVAMALTFTGAVGKLVIHSRLERLYRETSPVGSDVGR
jgi:hypothetical protein